MDNYTDWWALSQPLCGVDNLAVRGDTTTMKIRKISHLACCAIFVAVCLGGTLLRGATTRPSKKAPVRVLFLGNSYTYGNKLPQVVAGLAAADKSARPLEVKMVASGGKNLVWHAGNKASQEAIATGRWDYVILQDQSLTPTLMPDRTRQGAGKLNAAITKSGARTMFFMTWQRRPTPELLKKYPDMHKRNSKTYMDVGRELKAAVAPVGYAWKMAYDANPKWPLYAKDNSHPSRMGTYLTACVFYSTIYNKSPAGLPAKVILSKSGTHRTVLGIPPSDAKKLQAIAWQAVRQAKKELADKPPARPSKQR
ncbi:MAG: SGNH/GDSL hydrolase family protein [Phycisphaerae bacterium]|nr:SGNH/GDSL hydrolase family protein [Phycisphaerae bacterium]